MAGTVPVSGHPITLGERWSSSAPATGWTACVAKNAWDADRALPSPPSETEAPAASRSWHARRKGIDFFFLARAVEILHDERRRAGIKVEKMVLGEPDEKDGASPCRWRVRRPGLRHRDLCVGTRQPIVTKSIPPGPDTVGLHRRPTRPRRPPACGGVRGGDISPAPRVILAMAGRRAAPRDRAYLQGTSRPGRSRRPRSTLRAATPWDDRTGRPATRPAPERDQP